VIWVEDIDLSKSFCKIHREQTHRNYKIFTLSNVEPPPVTDQTNLFFDQFYDPIMSLIKFVTLSTPLSQQCSPFDRWVKAKILNWNAWFMVTEPEPNLSEINSDNICVGKRVVGWQKR
jgi:hypothetical protein